MRGIVRGIGRQGRVVIPKEMLPGLGVTTGDLVEIGTGQDPDGIPCLYLRRYTPGCALCGEELPAQNAVLVHGRALCQDCITYISQRERRKQ